MSMMVYNTNGVSSSLAKPSDEQFWNSDKTRGDGKAMLVPVITLSSVINAIPTTTNISLIKTDMQGFDFVAIKEAATALKKRVTHLYTEVWFDDTYTYHAENDLCRDWLPFMTELGYVLVRTNGKGDDVKEIRANCEKQLKDRPVRPDVEASAGLNEGDAFWVREDAVGEPFPQCETTPPNFSANEYSSC